MLLEGILMMSAAIVSPQAEVPYRQPQLAAGHGRVGMVFGGGKALYFSGSADGGKTFGQPVKIAEVGALALGRHRGPRMVVLKDTVVVSAIAGQQVATGPHAHGLPEAGNLLVWRSEDGGKTWKQGGQVNDVAGAAREGLHAMAAGADGAVYAVWLDLRGKGTTLYGSKSVDGGRTWSKNVEVYRSPDGTICQCCHPSLLVDSENRIWAMWRNVVDGSRDMYVASSVDGGRFTAAVKQGPGTWKLNACPMDGGAFAVRDGKVISAWRRDGELYVAKDGAEQKVGVGKDVALAVGKKGEYVAWTNGGNVEILTPGAKAARVLGTGGGFVTLLAMRDGRVLAAWEGGGAVHTAVVDGM